MMGFFLPVHAAEGDATWANSTVVGPSGSIFSSVSSDSSGNSYAVGYIKGTGTFNFGNSVTVAGAYNGDNAVIIKYNSSGVAQWAKVATTAPNTSYFNGVFTDSSGNSYIAGQLSGTGTFDFGNSVTLAGTYSFANILIIKYNSSGVAQWAKTVSAGSGNSIFNTLYVDSSGNSYAVGTVFDTGLYSFGNGVNVTGACSGCNTALIIKYSSSGVAQWAKVATTAPNTSSFNSISMDTSGNSYVSGYIIGNTQFNFGNSITVTGLHNNYNALIIKYNSSGVAQWAKVATTAPDDSVFNSISTDSSGNSYVVGYIYDTNQFNFGNNVILNGAASTNNNAFIIKYDSSGTPQWGSTTTTASNYSVYYGVAIDSSGNSYAVGEAGGTSPFGFGNSITVTPGNSSSNAVLVKYSSSGLAQYAKSTVIGPDYSIYNGVNVGSSGTIYTDGEFDSNSVFNLGNSVTLTGANATYNIGIVSYEGAPAQTPTPSSASNTSSNSVSSPNCRGVVITQTPSIFKAERNTTSVNLYFNPIANANSYSISYGLKEGNDLYSETFSTGVSSGVLERTIYSLSPATKYLFRIHARNDCSDGPWSGYFKVLARSETPEPTISPSPEPQPIVTQISSDTNSESNIVVTPQDIENNTNLSATKIALFGGIAVIVYLGSISLVTIIGLSKILFSVYSQTARSILFFPSDLFKGSFQYCFYFIGSIGANLFGYKNNKEIKDGQSYISTTNDPLGGVYIIFYSESGNLKSTVTKYDGTYDVVLKPDDYELKAHKINYIFPSKIVNYESNNYRSNIYVQGKKLIITDANSKVTNLSVPLDPKV